MTGKPKDDPVALEPCGTEAAYRRHLRHGEMPCLACLNAKARYEQDRRRAGYLRPDRKQP